MRLKSAVAGEHLNDRNYVMCDCKEAKDMDVEYSVLTDFDAWLVLAREVEHLFGPMADEANFKNALEEAIVNNAAFCIRAHSDEGDKILGGGIIISKESNEIAWLAVSEKCRGKGYGRKLLEFAISRLDIRKDIFVQTFDKSVSEGKVARKLYYDFGFADYKNDGLNPAGIPTVIMRLPGDESNGS
jgi:GNAT superfamily N-acetyltransferase